MQQYAFEKRDLGFTGEDEVIHNVSVGDCNAEEETDAVILAMCGLLG
jgi:hypothetical protein